MGSADDRNGPRFKKILYVRFILSHLQPLNILSLLANFLESG